MRSPGLVSASSRSMVWRTLSGARSRRPTKRARTPCRTRSGSSRSTASTKSCMRASTSCWGRDQFSVENANTQSDSTPRSSDASIVRRSARVPAECPATTGRRRFRAQRALPSMMIATERAEAGRAGSSAGRSRRSARSRLTRLTAVVSGMSSRRGAESSYLHDLLFLLLEEIVDLVHVLVRDLLQPVLCAPLLVVTDVSVADELLEIVHDVAPDVADRDPSLLGEVADDLDELLAALLGQRRDGQADQLAVVR